MDAFEAESEKIAQAYPDENSMISLEEAEEMLSTRQQISEEIDNYVNDHSSMMEYDGKVIADPSIFDDSQMFNRDAKQAEMLPSGRDHLPSKDKPPSNLEPGEIIMKRHEAPLTTMDINDDKVNGVLSFGDRLSRGKNLVIDNISKRLEEISNRRNNNRAAVIEQPERTCDQHLLHILHQDCKEIHDWTQQQKILGKADTKEKGRRMFDTERGILYDQSCAGIDRYWYCKRY